MAQALQDTTECFYEILERCEKDLLYSIGYNDQYRHAANDINVLTEPCDVIRYISVCFELFKLTGKVKYLDTIELCYYNAMLASPCKDGKWARGLCAARACMSMHRTRPT